MKTKNKITTLFLLATLLLPFQAFGRTINEEELNFPLNNQALLNGDTQIALEMVGTKTFLSREPLFKALDFFDLKNFQNDKILAAKYAFTVNRGIEEFGKKKIFTAEDFENISKNVTVRGSETVSSTQISFDINKKIKFYNLRSKVDYYHINLREEAPTEGPQALFVDVISRELPDGGLNPDIITVHDTYRFSSFFNRAINVCLYKSMSPRQTLISCYIMSSITSGTVSTLGFFVNFPNSLKEEILYSISKIKN